VNEQDGEVAAFMRRFYELSPAGQLAAWLAARAYLGSAAESTEADDELEERHAALGVMRAVCTELSLPEGAAPTARQFDSSTVARDGGWSSARVTGAFGRWRFACDQLLDRTRRRSATQRAAVRASRRGVQRERDDYLRGIRLWLSTTDAASCALDYDAWRSEYNESRAEGEPPLVSYSRLRQVFHCSWDDLKKLALGELTPEGAGARASRRPRVVRHGPHDLIAFGEVRSLLGLGLTAARNETRSPRFPAPAYTHPRGARNRLWLHSDVQAYLRGEPGPRREANHLQELYLDAVAVAHLLKLAVISVSTRSSPRVPEPTVSLGGLQLWLRDQIQSP
jgi:hypothetical protein